MRMRDLYSKTNAPYLIAGAFATLVLLASGTLAVAPYVAFLSPIAVFNVALPVALSLSILSTLILALSCKMISNNKKIEVEKNKFAEKEQELESVKQQFESKVQELENKIALGKEAASKEVEELNNQLNRLTREKQDADRVIEGLNKKIEQLKKQLTDARQESNRKGQELKAANKQVEELNNQLNEFTQEKKDLDERVKELNKKVSQLECEKKNSLHYTEELRDENARLNERVGSLMEELSQPQREVDSLERQLHELKYEGTLALLLEERITELETCLKKRRKKVGELVVQLRKEKGETSSLQTELKSAKEKEEEILSTKKLSELTKKMHQLAADLEQKEKLCKELEEEKTKDLDKIGELNKLLDQERKENEKLRDNNSKLKSSKKDLDDECSKLRRRNSNLERKVKRLQAVIGQEDKQSHSISSDISSEHLSELEGIGENESVNKQFPKPKPPYISTPIRPPYKKLNDASCDSGYFSRCSTPPNSY